jgi:4-amino-4-deoxychorismate lyase
MSESRPLISVNGVIDAGLSPLDRGLAYGDGLFETCLVKAGVIPLWPWHKARLLGSAARLQLKCDLPRLYGYMRELLASLPAAEGVLKIILTRGQGGRGYRLPADTQPSICLVFMPGALPLQQGVVAHLCRQRLMPSPSLAGLKHLNRLEQVLARAEWPATDDSREGLLLDAQGRVVEATASNLFVVSDGRLLTPDLSLCGVAGIMRQLILERLAPSLHIPCCVTHLGPEDLYRSDEIFLCNSIRGIWPVLGLEMPARALVKGTVTARLQEALAGFLESTLTAAEACPWRE